MHRYKGSGPDYHFFKVRSDQKRIASATMVLIFFFIERKFKLSYPPSSFNKN